MHFAGLSALLETDSQFETGKALRNRAKTGRVKPLARTRVDRGNDVDRFRSEGHTAVRSPYPPWLDCR